ncbi:MAG: DUF624 domain-containing protein [Lachnospiraceae bacterium]|nr:DUF624 domain-containing protein [Lachnospiraceae bacterium]
MFQTEGPLLSRLNVLTDLVAVNLMTVLMCLPVITAGASLSAMHCVVRSIRHDGGGRLVPLFFSELRTRLKQGIPVFLPMLLILLLGSFEAGVFLLQENQAGRLYAYVLFAAILFAAFLENTALLVLSYGPDRVSRIGSNTLRLAFGRFPRMLGSAFLMLLPVLMLVFLPALLPLYLLLGVTAPAMAASYVYEPVIQSFADRKDPKQTEQEASWPH